MPKGKVYLTGAGPGNPGLITLKAIEALKKADVVIYDFLAGTALLEYAKKNTLCIYAGKKGRHKHISQEKINRLIIKYAKKGKTVVRLKGGDPFVFGRGAEEALELEKAGIPFEVIPGVSSAIAAPLYAGIPVTHRGISSSVTIVTGQEGKGKEKIKWDKLAESSSTLVILMGWKNISSIAKKLIESGKDPATPVAMIRWGTTSKQRCVTGRLDNIGAIVKQKRILPPVVTVVGDIVRLREKLNWFETKPLFGRRIVVTRTLEQAGAFTEKLSEMGAEPIGFSTIKIVPPKSVKALHRAIKGGLSRYDWAIFTSVNGVKYFFEGLYALGFDVRELKGVKICAIGPATEKAIEERGIKIDLTPKKYIAEGVIEALGEKGIRGKRFLLPRAMKARETLPEEIKRLGGKIDVVTVYRTVRPVREARRIKEILKKEPVDVVTFTSSSTVENFAALFKKSELKKFLGKGVKVACIGPVTAKTARGLGLKVAIMPKKYTIPDFAQAIADYFSGGKKERA